MDKAQVTILTSARVFAANSSTSAATGRISHRLSIIDAACAHFTPTGALWYFNPPEKHRNFDSNYLAQSLRYVLGLFPLFQGRLRMVHSDGDDDRRTRRAFYNRLEVWYNDDGAPGVQFDVASCELTIQEVVPSAEAQVNNISWRATDLLREDLFFQSSLANGMTAPTSDGLEATLPVMVIQLTTMSDGGLVLGVKISHPLADAHTLMLFMREWSQQHTLLVQKGSFYQPPLELEKYIYDAGQIDGAGTEAARNGDEAEVVAKALAAPMHRYDQWDNEGAPFQSAAMRPPKLLEDRIESKVPLVNGKKMPWDEWDKTAPVEHTVLRFNKFELEALRGAVRFEQDPDIRMPSTLDILIAHLWVIINRARGYANDKDNGEVYADISFGLRARLDPPLSTNTLGSPLANMAVPMSGHQACSPKHLSAVANRIRKTMSKLTPDVLAAHVYGLMQEVTPQRIWQVFLGHRHLLITSWVHTGVYNVDFGGGQTARYVHPIMPMIDGCIQIIESPPVAERVGSGIGQWYDQGISVNVYLEAKTSARVIADSDLHPATVDLN